MKWDQGIAHYAPYVAIATAVLIVMYVFAGVIQSYN
jgi:hypothetical protein